jgi:hypothetical protein
MANSPSVSKIPPKKLQPLNPPSGVGGLTVVGVGSGVEGKVVGAAVVDTVVVLVVG